MKAKESRDVNTMMANVIQSGRIAFASKCYQIPEGEDEPVVVTRDWTAK